jgi:hypothetical protein
MIKLGWVYLSTEVILLALLLNSCCKNGNTSPAQTDYICNYLIEADNNYRIYKVSFSDQQDSYKNWIREYSYSQESIMVNSYSTRNGEKTIYYINNLGLADSSIYSYQYNNSTISSKTYYRYNYENYLLMAIHPGYNIGQPPDTTYFEYINGNKSKTYKSKYYNSPSFPQTFTYTYNSIKNIIDIESFNGSFVGRLNQNLIGTLTYYGSPEGIRNSTYQYIKNSDGLVEERKCKSWTAGSTDPASFYIDKFEYKFR